MLFSSYVLLITLLYIISLYIIHVSNINKYTYNFFKVTRNNLTYYNIRYNVQTLVLRLQQKIFFEAPIARCDH